MTHRRPKLFTILYYALLLLAIQTPSPAPAAPEGFVAPEPAVAPLDSAPFGLNTHLATRYPDLQGMETPADLVVQTGAGWSREDIHWWRVQETPGAWDWSYTDQAMRVLLQRNIKIVGVLGHPPGWATPFSGDAPDEVTFYPPDPQQFAFFAQAVVQRYGKYIHYWEIWNEPDNIHFWKPAPDPVAYAALLKQTALAIRSVDHDAKILIGGFNPFDTDFLRRVAETGAWDSFDILAIHPYVNPTEPEAGNLLAAADGVRAFAERYSPKPIWVTEIGWTSRAGERDPDGLTDEQEQANYLVRATLLLWRSGIERIFWYSLKDDPASPYGLVAYGAGRTDYRSIKPSFFAFRNLSQQLNNTQFVGMRDLFSRTTVFDFESFGSWIRGDQRLGEFKRTTALQQSKQSAGQLTYTFPTPGNDYVVFTREQPVPVPGQPYALGVWVYGDGSGNTVKVWLRDSEGETLQFALGTVGPTGWRFLQTPIGGSVAEWNRINKGGNGKVDFPVSVQAIVLDDAPDTFIGNGVIYLDDMMAISGPEAYNLQLQRDAISIDVLWAPGAVRARFPSASTTVEVVDRDGRRITAPVADGFVRLELGPSPIYIQHQR